MSKVTKYGIRNKKTKKLMELSVSSVDSHDPTVEYSLEEGYGDNPQWLVKDEYTVEYVLRNSTEWYNSSSETPQHSVSDKTHEIVKVEMEITESTICRAEYFLTDEEILDLKYGRAGEKNQGHIDYCKKMAETGTVSFSLNDHKEANRILDRLRRDIVKASWPGIVFTGVGREKYTIRLGKEKIVSNTFTSCIYKAWCYLDSEGRLVERKKKVKK